MGKPRCQRKSCKDVFNARLVSTARYAGYFELPAIEAAQWIPNRLIPFSKAISSKDHDQWIHFYEDDYLFERLWRNPERYLDALRRFNGVILPDFSVYRDMPLIMQMWNIYRSRAVGSWLQNNGIKTIANVRYGDERTYRYCCEGIPRHSSIAIGTHGLIKDEENRRYLAAGLQVVVETILPCALVIYGPAPDSIFAKYREDGIRITAFEPAISSAHKKAR